MTFSQNLEKLLLLGEGGSVVLLFYLTKERHYNCGVTYPSVEAVILKTITTESDWQSVIQFALQKFFKLSKCSALDNGLKQSTLDCINS